MTGGIRGLQPTDAADGEVSAKVQMYGEASAVADGNGKPLGAAGAVSSAGVRPIRVVPVQGTAPNDNTALRWLYRGVEIVIAIIALVVSFPIMLLEGLLIRLDSEGPALFFQRRTGASAKVRGRDIEVRPDLLLPQDGIDPDAYYYVPRTFRFVKFRTMYNDARIRFPELYDYSFRNESFDDSYTKSKSVIDPRITRLGRYLRKLTVDELPNFWCVLTGSMTLVGPRPEQPDVVHAYPAEGMYKFTVKPGITGLAQINGRGMLTRGETLAWDLEYVRNRSVWLDLKIIFKTLWLVLTRHGAF